MTRGSGSGNGAPSADDKTHDSPPARSWSQLVSYRSCSMAWWLAKVRRVPRRPGVWLPAGTALHSTIEIYHRQRLEAAKHG